MKSILSLLFCIISIKLAATAVPGVTGPLHASCKIVWLWANTDCKLVHSKIIDQMEEWKTEDNCKDGGEKCLYTMTSQTDKQIKGTHMTPVKHYIDDLTFDFTQVNDNCQVNVIKISI